MKWLGKLSLWCVGLRSCAHFDVVYSCWKYKQQPSRELASWAKRARRQKKKLCTQRWCRRSTPPDKTIKTTHMSAVCLLWKVVTKLSYNNVFIYIHFSPKKENHQFNLTITFNWLALANSGGVKTIFTKNSFENKKKIIVLMLFTS